MHVILIVVELEPESTTSMSPERDLIVVESGPVRVEPDRVESESGPERECWIESGPVRARAVSKSVV